MPIQTPNTDLLEILRVVLRGHKDDCLILGLHHAAEQVEQHSWFVISTDVEESQLQREGRAQPFWAPRLLGTLRSAHSFLGWSPLMSLQTTWGNLWAWEHLVLEGEAQSSP